MEAFDDDLTIIQVDAHSLRELLSEPPALPLPLTRRKHDEMAGQVYLLTTRRLSN